MMSYGKDIKDINNNLNVLSNISLNVLTDFRSFCATNGINPQGLSTIAYSSEIFVKNFIANIGYLKSKMNLDEKTISKHGHNFSIVEPENVVAVYEVLEKYSVKAENSSGKADLRLFTIDASLLKSYIEYLIERGFFIPGMELSKQENGQLISNLLKAEEDVMFKNSMNEANSYLMEHYGDIVAMLQNDVKPLEVVKEQSFEEALDAFRIGGNANSSFMAENLNIALKSMVTYEDNVTYKVNGVTLLKERVDNNITQFSNKDVDEEKALYVALFLNSFSSTDQIHTVMGLSDVYTKGAA